MASVAYARRPDSANTGPLRSLATAANEYSPSWSHRFGLAATPELPEWGDRSGSWYGASGSGDREPSFLNPDGMGEAMTEEAHGERPQVLAQLAGAISELIQGARAANAANSELPKDVPRASPAARAASEVRALEMEPRPAPAEPQRLSPLGRACDGRTGATVVYDLWSKGQALSGPLGQQRCGQPRSHASSSTEGVSSWHSQAAEEARHADASSCFLQLHAGPPDGGTSSAVKPHSPVNVAVPHEVQTLLAAIEGRESGLRMQVQQLTEEKDAHHRHLESELARLQMSNARMADELRQAREAGSSEVAVQGCAASSTGGNLPVQAPALANSDELKQHLDELRGEVARCMHAVREPQTPKAEVADIRQQLAALSAEVQQTSQMLFAREARGSSSPSAAEDEERTRETEVLDVRRQLAELHGQVSSVLAATRSPSSQAQLPEQGVNVAAAAMRQDVSQLQAEIDHIRAEMATRVASCSTGMPHDSVSTHALSRVAPPRSQQPLVEFSDMDVLVEALRLEVGRLRQEAPPAAARPFVAPLASPLGTPMPAPEVVALNTRLASVRARIAQAVYGMPPELRFQSPEFSGLLAELQEVRTSAAAIATAGLSSAPSVHLVYPGVEVDASRDSERLHALGTSTPSRCLPRPCSPAWKEGSVVDGRYVDVRPRQLPDHRLGELAHGPYHASLAYDAPLLVCPHVAASHAAGALPVVAPGAASERSAGLSRGFPYGGCALGPGSALPSRGVASAALSPRSIAESAGPPELPRPVALGARFGPASVPPSWNLGSAPPSPRSNAESSWGHSRAGGTFAASSGGREGKGAGSSPPAEPIDRAPQGAMQRPMRTKLYR